MGSLPANAAAALVLVDPLVPERVYAADATLLYRSDDGGRTWQPAARNVATLALDPRQPRRLYAVTPTGEFHLSEDWSTTWQPLSGAVADGPT